MEPYCLIEYKKTQLTKNFQTWEFFFPDYSAAYKIAAKPFYLPGNLVQACQLIRGYYGKPVFITSTYRPHVSQLQHYIKKAVDLTFGKDKTQLDQMLNSFLINRNSDSLFAQLRSIGITGFGLESNHLHIDVRSAKFNNTDKFGNYCLFQL
jgi:hypothetical protein